MSFGPEYVDDESAHKLAYIPWRKQVVDAQDEIRKAVNVLLADVEALVRNGVSEPFALSDKAESGDD